MTTGLREQCVNMYIQHNYHLRFFFSFSESAAWRPSGDGHLVVHNV